MRAPSRHGADHLRVLAHAEIVVGAPDDDFARAFRRQAPDGVREAAGDPLEIGEHPVAPLDLVLAMEVVEHVADVDLFVKRAGEMVKPGGMMVAATINRTFKSFALAIVGAEYVLGWLPRGTHSWDKLVTPDELDRAFAHAGLEPAHSTGVIYNLFADAWQLSDDMDVNYMMTATRPD
jgi:ubiquinone biosynthesis O-methyltransferase